MRIIIHIIRDIFLFVTVGRVNQEGHLGLLGYKNSAPAIIQTFF